MYKPLLLGILLFTGGCNVLPDRTPSPALHDFGPIFTGMPGHTSNRLSIVAPDWLATDRIYYRLTFADPSRMLSYNLDRWLAPPADLLMQYLSFKTGDGTALKLTLLNFEQIFDTPESARVFIRVRVVTTSTQQGSASHQQEFQFTRPCLDPDGRGAVAAFSKLIPIVQRDIQKWIDTL